MICGIECSGKIDWYHFAKAGNGNVSEDCNYNALRRLPDHDTNQDLVTSKTLAKFLSDKQARDISIFRVHASSYFYICHPPPTKGVIEATFRVLNRGDALLTTKC
jgi:hypothetical protein